MTEDRVVWVVETGCYENRGVEGVYDSIEAAIAHNPIPENFRYPDKPSAYDSSRPGGWKCDKSGDWHNGLDWDSAASAYSTTLKGMP